MMWYELKQAHIVVYGNENILDLRNHGRSTKTNNHSYLLMSNDIFNFIKMHNINNVYIIGHSMGGKLAIKFATLHPKLVEKLLIIDILPIKYELQQEHKNRLNQNSLIHTAIAMPKYQCKVMYSFW